MGTPMSVPNLCRKRDPQIAGIACCSNKRHHRSSSSVGYRREVLSWEMLDDDLVRLIAARVLAGDLLDYVRLRAVCPHWRSSTTCPRGLGVVDPRFHPKRWMMLPEGHGLYPGHPNLGGHVRFFNLDTGAFVRVHLPLFRDHCVLDSVDGLLVLQRDEDTAIRIMHPFTGDIAEFPPLVTLVPQLNPELLWMGVPGQGHFFVRGVCTALSFTAAGDITVMLGLFRIGYIAFATTGDSKWTLSTWKYPICSTPFAFQGKLYTVNDPMAASTAEIFQIDPPQLPELGPSQPKLIATCPAGKLFVPYYMVECDSQILVVGHSDRSFSSIIVYRLADLVLGRIIPLTSIAGYALFVEEKSVCISSKALPTIESDTVVYLHPKKLYLAQYHISSGLLSRAMDGCILSCASPGPCSLIHHVITCCNRQYWNKGQMLIKHCNPKWPVKEEWRLGA